ncbi:MAG: peptide chain release factor aRF-1 [Thermoproteota archaeon]|nr:peptide chain release factor aRF-1 [Thermoproteota archaeon]
MKGKRSSLEQFRLKRALKTLACKEGRGTELVSLYVPPGRQISEVVSMLDQEYGTASNIKSDTTRKNVQDAIVKVKQRVKLFKQVPEKGLVVFCGAIPQNGVGSERIETYVITPPKPINVYLYRCDSKFHIEHLQELIKKKVAFGILLVDATAATFAVLRGSHLEIAHEITSGVPGKHRAGGQSARRFERLRDARLLNYFKRVGKHANEIFLSVSDLKGLIIAGPGSTKYDFKKGDHLHYTLKDKVVATVDTAYVGEQGVEEVTERASEIMSKIRYVEEKQLIQKFLYEVGHDTGLATYGEDEVRYALQTGAVETLLLSEAIETVRVTVKCTACNYSRQETMEKREVSSFEQKLMNQPCPKCDAPALFVAEVKDILEDLAELAAQAGAKVEIISTETEEGQMLKKSFGGIVARLRFQISS